MIFRAKRRYVLVRSSVPVDAVVSQYKLGESLLGLMGAEEYANAMPKVVKQIDDSTFILRVSRGSERKLVLALSFIKSLGSARLGFYTLRTSGSIAALLRKSGIMQAVP